MSESSWNKGLDDAACGVPPRGNYHNDNDYQNGYAFGDTRYESYIGELKQEEPRMSDMIFCPSCKLGTSDANVNCEHCGKPIPALCPDCNGEGYWDEVTGGCDSDGENDTRETFRVLCQKCQGTGTL